MGWFDRNGDQSQTCKICGKTCRALGNHLLEHKISAKKYYDCYIRKPNEGRCIICGKDTKFKTISIGYIGKYCSPKCMYSDKNHFNPEAWKATRNMKIQQFEKDHNCIFANDLRAEYGNGWYSSNIVNFIYMDSQTKFVPIDELQKIIDYASIKRPNCNTSHAEKDIVEYIKTFYTGIILENKRKVIYPFELDIYLPDLKIAIEYNGKWYHSINAGTPKDYHLHKSLLCRDKSIRLIHIYEFEDIDKQKYLLKELILGINKYPKNDFNKNNLLNTIPKPIKIYDNGYTIYGAGKLEVN